MLAGTLTASGVKSGNSSNRSESTSLAMPRPLAIGLKADAGGEPLAWEPITATDLAEAVAETWRELCLRKGELARPLCDVPMEVLPLFLRDAEGSRCRGFAIEVKPESGVARRKEFGLAALAGPAARLAEKLILSGTISADARVFYELTPACTADASPPTEVVQLTLRITSAAPHCLRVPLRPLLRESRVVEPLDEEAFPVFMTESAIAMAEACSRRGAARVPPVESGGVLVGAPAYCEVSKEFFVIVTDVIEAEEAEQKTFSLAYSARCWSRIEKIMSARREASPAGECAGDLGSFIPRLLGQCHGHNWLPEEGDRCVHCDQRAVCTLSSVFVSQDDRTWMRTVFARQPWALCLIFGLNARGDPVHRLYSLRDGGWHPRGYFVLPAFPLRGGA